MIEILKSNWAELLIGAMAFFKVIANVTPTGKDNKMFGYLDDLVSYFIKDKKIKSVSYTHLTLPTIYSV